MLTAVSAVIAVVCVFALGGAAAGLLVRWRREEPAVAKSNADGAPGQSLPPDRWMRDYGFLLFVTGLLCFMWRLLVLLNPSELQRFREPADLLLDAGGLVLMAVGLGMRLGKRWGWIGGLIISLALLCWPPFGSLFGLLGLWVLLRQPARSRFMVDEWHPWVRQLVRPLYLTPLIIAVCFVIVWMSFLRIPLLDALGLLKARTSFLAEAGQRCRDIRWDNERQAVVYEREGRILVLQDSAARARVNIMLASVHGSDTPYTELAYMPVLVEDLEDFGIVWSACGGIRFHKFDRDGRLIYTVSVPDAHHAHANALLAEKTGILCISNMEGVSMYGGPTVHLYDWATGERLRVISDGGGTMALSADEETLYVAGWFGCTAIPLTR